jgi:hypothetical protein
MILLNGRTYFIDTAFTVNGVQYPANWYRTAGPLRRAALGFTEVPDPANIDQRFYYIDSGGNVLQRPLRVCKEYFLDQTSSIRWGKEQEGITLANTVYATDHISRINYLGALMQSTINPAFTVTWKARDMADAPKYVTLDANSLVQVVSAGIGYISACFEYEKTLRETIAGAANLDVLLTIDTSAGWPTNSY